MAKPASRMRLKFRSTRHAKDAGEILAVGTTEKPHVARDRVRACLVQDRLEGLKYDEENLDRVCEPAPVDVNESVSSPEDLPQRLMLLNVVGSEASTIRQALTVCGKISQSLGQRLPSFADTLGMKFEFDAGN